MLEPLRSPASFLASIFLNGEQTARLVLVTGESGSGKTTWCRELVQQARQAGLFPQGILSPAVFEDGCKIAIDLQDIQTGERRRLAVRRPRTAPESDPSPHTRAWQFDPEVLDWASRLLGGLGTGEMLILDELGPLEFLEGRGLVSGLKLVDERRYRLACFTVRPGLLAAARERWPWAEVLDLAQPGLAPPRRQS